MPASPELRLKTIQAIGELLSEEDLVKVVRQATGQNVFNIYCSRIDPRATQLDRTLEKLELDGHERWLLTYILIAIMRDTIRKQIVRTWPKTLVGLPQAEDQVTNALTYLNSVLKLPLSNDIKLELKLKLKQNAFKEIRQRIEVLYTYKNLHEDLHQLSLKLTFGELVQPTEAANPDFKGIAEQCDKTLSESPFVEESLGKNSVEAGIELGWIARLRAITDQLKSALAASDVAGCLRAVDDIQQLVKMNLSRLNAKVFKAATDLSFEALTSDLPETLEEETAYDSLVQAIRELTPTVLARALKHSLWQETENDISLVGDFFNIPGQEIADISESWFSVKTRVRWLAELDPDDPWADEARQFSDRIDDQMVQKKKLDDQIKEQFERYRNLFRFRFLAIDNTLKLDCGALRKIDTPLAAILNELDPPKDAAKEPGP